MSSVTLITNNSDIKLRVKNNLGLLRTSDSFTVLEFQNAIDTLQSIRPDVVLLYGDKNDILGILDVIGGMSDCLDISVILLLDALDTDFVLKVFDKGVSDYCLLSENSSDLVLRIFNAIKRTSMLKKIRQLKSQMNCFGIMDKSGSFYTNKEVVKSEFKKVALHSHSYMIIGHDELGKNLYSEKSMSEAIVKSVRSTDTVSILQGGKFSILLSGGVESAINVFQKIKSEGLSVKAGIAVVTEKDFENIEKRALSAFNSAILDNVDYRIYMSETAVSEEWVDCSEGGEKAFKLFKNIYKQKVDNVISPVFFRFQKSYEEKFEDVKISQFANVHESIFRISDSTHESRLTIAAPRYSRVFVVITHLGLDTPENSKIELSLNKITTGCISEIVESFIQNFLERKNNEFVERK